MRNWGSTAYGNGSAAASAAITPSSSLLRLFSMGHNLPDFCLKPHVASSDTPIRSYTHEDDTHKHALAICSQHRSRSRRIMFSPAVLSSGNHSRTCLFHGAAVARAHGDTNAFCTMPHADAFFVLVVLTDAEFALIFADLIMPTKSIGL